MVNFFLIFKIVFENRLKIFKNKKFYVEKEINEEVFRKLEIEYQQNLFKHHTNFDILESEFIEQINIYNEKIISNKQRIKMHIYQKFLNANLPASRGSISLRRGYTELLFLKYIGEELKGLIFADMVPRIDFYEERNTYNPDFTLICNKTNLHIDIEIDEPYSMFEKQPIHYIGCSDDQRNNFFIENNWCIIRFSERQIIVNPLECLETIKSVYNSIIDMNEYYSTHLKLEPRWTYEESLIMQKNKYRENYLS